MNRLSKFLTAFDKKKVKIRNFKAVILIVYKNIFLKYNSISREQLAYRNTLGIYHMPTNRLG